MRRRSPRGVAFVHDHRHAGDVAPQDGVVLRFCRLPALVTISEDPVEGDTASAPQHVFPGLQPVLATGAAISDPAAARTPIAAASATSLVLTMTSVVQGPGAGGCCHPYISICCEGLKGRAARRAVDRQPSVPG